MLLALPGLFFGSGLIGGVVARDGELFGIGLGFGLPLLVLAGIVLACGWRPYVALNADTLVVQNPLRRHRVPVQDVLDARAWRGGMRIRLRDGSEVHAVALPQTPLADLLLFTTRSDLIAQEIRQAAGNRRRQLRPRRRRVRG